MESMWISEKRGLKESSVLIFHSRKSTQKQKSSSSNITVSLGSMENHWKSWKWFPQENEKQRGNHSVGMKTVTFHNKLLGTILTLQSMWKINTERISSVQSLSRVQLFATTWTTALQASLSITNSRSPPKPMSTESSPSPPAFNLSQHQGLFQWVSSSHQVAKLLEFQLQHQSFQ